MYENPLVQHPSRYTFFMPHVYSNDNYLSKNPIQRNPDDTQKYCFEQCISQSKQTEN